MADKVRINYYGKSSRVIVLSKLRLGLIVTIVYFIYNNIDRLSV